MVYIYIIYIMSIFLLIRDQLHDFMFSMVVMFTPNSWTSIWSNMNMIDIFPIYLAGKLMQTWGPKMDCFLVSRKGINLVKPVVPRFWSSNRTGPSAQCNSCDDGQLDACSWVAACHPRTCSKTHEGFQDVLTPIIYVYHTSIYIYIYYISPGMNTHFPTTLVFIIGFWPIAIYEWNNWQDALRIVSSLSILQAGYVWACGSQ